MTSAQRQTLRGLLKELYADLQAEIERAEPACALSGRCCRFAEYGHTLFVSEPEFVVFLEEAPPPIRPFDDGETCPWQDHLGRCTARDARPLGCRVFFCDPAYQDKAHALSEEFVGRLKRLAADHSIPWNYQPWHRHLRVIAQQLAGAGVPGELGSRIGS